MIALSFLKIAAPRPCSRSVLFRFSKFLLHLLAQACCFVSQNCRFVSLLKLAVTLFYSSLLNIACIAALPFRFSRSLISPLCLSAQEPISLYRFSLQVL
jgi:hypothetical protein